MAPGFSSADYLILIAYVAASVAVGLWFARGERTVEGYYLAGRAAPWWAVALSIICSDTSAVSYLGCAAFVFTGDLQLLLGSLALPLAAIFVSYVFIPILARRRVFTVYEYLEQRFSGGARTLASALFLLMRGSHLAVALYAAALVVAEVMGLSIGVSLCALGGLTTLYTVFGGMRAVLWTDVIQFFVLMGGLIAILVGVAIAFHWDLALLWQTASHPVPPDAPWLAGHPESSGHTRIAEFRFSFVGMNFWAIMLSLFLQSVGAYGSDQVLVQRYLATASRGEMVRSLVGGGLIILPVNLLMYCSGAFLVAYYSRFLHDPAHDWVHGLTDANRVVTHFVTHGIPGALGAIVIAGLFAGTMSSLSAGLNSLSAATYGDFLRRFGWVGRQPSRVLWPKLITCAWGVLIITTAGTVGGNQTIFAALAKVMSPFSAPLVGLFLLGMISPRANTRGAMTGALVGVLATLGVTYFTDVHWLWYFVVGSLCSLGAGYIFSWLFPSRPTAEPAGFAPVYFREPQRESPAP